MVKEKYENEKIMLLCVCTVTLLKVLFSLSLLSVHCTHHTWLGATFVFSKPHDDKEEGRGVGGCRVETASHYSFLFSRLGNLPSFWEIYVYNNTSNIQKPSTDDDGGIEVKHIYLWFYWGRHLIAGAIQPTVITGYFDTCPVD